VLRAARLLARQRDLRAGAPRQQPQEPVAHTRALSAITALQLGVSGDHDTAQALRHLYEATRRAILDSAIHFDAALLGTIRQDFVEISRAVNAAAGQA
jgi:hypothetical protein